MLVKVPRTWEVPEREVTPESVYLDRRRFLKGFAGGAVFLSALGRSLPAWAQEKIPGLKVNQAYKVSDPKRPVTTEKIATSYNNFYEFSLEKEEVAKVISKWKTEGWQVEVAGHCAKPGRFSVDDLVKKFGVEERVYRFRCVEAWSMVLPWAGFPLESLIRAVEPTAKAKYVRFTSFKDEKSAPNFSRLPNYPWPYVEGLTMEEAKNPLAFLATGLYGKPLPKQNGAPIRLVVPWKYGFKSIKSIVKIELVEQRPVSLWETLAPKEYGFYANVNPKVAHPRWSQASERIVDGSWLPKRIPTLMFNGYEKEVAGLYAGLDLEKNY